MAQQQHYFTASEETQAFREITVDLGFGQQAITVSNGVFSANGLDKGTAVLLDYLKSSRGSSVLGDLPDGASLLDLGCGWGPILLFSQQLLKDGNRSSEQPVQFFGVDVNTDALELTRRNLEAAGVEATLGTPEQLSELQQFDLVLSNPPIRVGKDILHAALTRWYWQLKDGGKMVMVVQKNLGSDSLSSWMTSNLPGCKVTKLASSKGFRILQVDKTGTIVI